MGQTRIVVNALAGKTGSGPVYISNLFPAMAKKAAQHHFILLADPETAAGLPAMPGNVEIVDDAFRSASGTKRVLWEQVRLGRLLKRMRANMLFSPFNTAPLRLHVPNVMVVHVNFSNVKQYTRGFGARLRWDLLYWISGLAARRATRVIAVSGMVRDFLVNERGVQAERVRIVYHPCAEYFRPMDVQSVRDTAAGKFGIERAYVLMVADVYRHKNIERLLEAFAGVNAELGGEYELVLAGRPVDGAHMEELRAKAKALGISDRFRYLGPVAHRDLPAMFSGATISVLPSLSETFGMPLVESMACGTPVAGSRIAAFEEVVGEAGVLFDPCDVEGMRTTLRRLLTDEGLRCELRRKGLERAGMFSHERFVSETLGVIEEALAETGTPRR